MEKIFFKIPFFQSVNECVKCHCNKTENADAHKKPGHFKCLTCINDQIPESAFCGKKFTNHDSYKTEADIYFHVAYDRGGGFKSKLKYMRKNIRGDSSSFQGTFILRLEIYRRF